MTKDERDILVVVLDELRTFREDTTSQFEDIRARLTNLEDAHREHIAGPGQQDQQIKLDFKKISVAGIAAGVLALLGYIADLLHK